ncbi:hypothetical protein CASFOL_010398 [Castilleja foliolosa]|uniref:Pectinesterase inhibitor domain-containing protein n=1 Tax=Castilleja foliolosa TaxID=1961234 RepID=A0ABD3DSG4_9LAMI
MAKRQFLTLPLLILVSFLCAPSGGESAAPAASFITNSCRATTYPSVCVQSLSSYASTIQKSPKQLVITALSVSVERAQSTKSFVRKLTKFRGLKPREYAAIKDCYDQISDSVGRLSDSARELKTLGRAGKTDFLWHMSNMQTWVSAALTDDSTCMDGFSGRALDGRIKSSVRARLTSVAQVTSNALALCNKFAGN